MKRNIILMLSILIVLAGCSQLNTIMDKMPWQKKDPKQTSVNDDDQIKKEHPSNGQANDQSAKDGQNNQLTLDSAFFNEIRMVDGKKVIQNPTNILALVNKQYALPNNYAPKDLVRPKVPFPFGDQKIEKSYMRKEAAEALEKMINAAKKENIIIYAVSGYRSYGRQQEVYSAEVNQVGKEQAEQAVAIPGFSEHQSGLAMDVSSPSNNFDLSENYGNTKEGKWLVANAHKFGFILRYPKGKEQITGYEYEPWHFRYVGIKAATDIYERDITLEEYFKIVEKI